MKAKKAGMAFILSAALLATAAGCGGNKEPESKEAGNTLSMAWWGNQTRNELTQAVLDKYHESNQEITVEGQFYQWNDYWSKMATSAAGNKLPDLVQMDYDYIRQYAEKEQLLDLTPYIENGALETDHIPEDVLSMGVVGNGNYGIAAGTSATALFYNKTLLDSIGITLKDNTTLDEFIEIAQEVQAKTGYRANIIAHGNYMENWARANGIQITGPEMGASSPEDYTGYFQILKEGIEKGWHLPTDLGVDTNAVEQNPMVYGSGPETMSWCALDGASLLQAYQDAAPEDMEIALTTVPASDPVKSNYVKPSMYFSISANTSDPDAAVEVLNYLINSVDANEIMLGERGVPASTEVAEAISGMLSEEGQTVSDFMLNILMPNSTPIAPPNPLGSSEVKDLLLQLEEKVGYGEVTPEEASKEYFEKGNQILAENN